MYGKIIFSTKMIISIIYFNISFMMQNVSFKKRLHLSNSQIHKVHYKLAVFLIYKRAAIEDLYASIWKNITILIYTV